MYRHPQKVLLWALIQNVDDAKHFLLQCTMYDLRRAGIWSKERLGRKPKEYSRFSLSVPALLLAQYSDNQLSVQECVILSATFIKLKKNHNVNCDLPSSRPRTAAHHDWLTKETSCVGGRHNMPAPTSWSLTFWHWKWCPSHVWHGLPLCQF